MHRGAHALWHLDPARTTPQWVRKHKGYWAQDAPLPPLSPVQVTGQVTQRVVMGGLLTSELALSQNGPRMGTILARQTYAEPPVVVSDISLAKAYNGSLDVCRHTLIPRWCPAT